MKKLFFILSVLCSQFLVAQDSYVIVEAQFDSYGPDESYFYISDGENTIFTYQPVEADELFKDTIPLPQGAYQLVIFDSFGDGWQDTGMAGWITVNNNCQGELLNIPANFDFGVSTYDFNIGPCDINGPPPVEGCTDAIAYNYDPAAVIDDGSCEYPPCGGITSSSAYQQCTNNGTQALIVFEWETEANANCDVVEVYYSNEEGAGPYNFPGNWPANNEYNNFAVYAGNGQMPPNWEVEHYLQLKFEDGSISDTIAFTPNPCIAGCTDESSNSYNPWATFDDGLCGATNCDPSTEYQITMQITLDNWPGETSWIMNGGLGPVGQVSVGEYDFGDIGQTYTYDFCVQQSGFELIINDDFGDGLAGSASGGTMDGKVVVFDCQGDTIWSMENPGFGDVLYSGVQVGVACSGPTTIDGCTDPMYQEFSPVANNDDGSCETLHIFGCTDDSMFNYNAYATIMSVVPICNYSLVLEDDGGDGWGNSYLGVVQGDNNWTFTMGPGSYMQEFPLVLTSDEPVKVYYFEVGGPQTTPEELNFQTLHNSFKLINSNGVALLEEGVNPFADNGQGALQGFKAPLWKKYTALPNCGDYCEPFVGGCMDQEATNYDITANVEDGSCYYAPGCTSSAYLEYYTQGFEADYNDGSCLTEAVWGCVDDTMYNYDPLANIDNGGCIPYIYGCMDPTAFNYDPLATAEDTCVEYVYGCTDPTMFNFNAEANTDNGSCIEYIYGCTDDTAINYDIIANTDNSSCVYPLPGCTDPTAENYNIDANVSDDSCYYSANCAVGDIYYIPNECFSWVIDIDSYCCDIAWDDSCVQLYEYCEEGWTGPVDISEFRDELVAYPNPVSNYIYVSKKVNLRVYNLLGSLVIEKKDTDALDVSKLASGIYNIVIEYNETIINKKIVKN